MFNSKWKTHWWVISQIHHEAACECKGVFDFFGVQIFTFKKGINLPHHINGRHPDRKSIHKEILGRVQTGRADKGFEDASRFFSKADSREQKEPVVSEEASMENKHYKIKAVALGCKVELDSMEKHCWHAETSQWWTTATSKAQLSRNGDTKKSAKVNNTENKQQYISDISFSGN